MIYKVTVQRETWSGKKTEVHEFVPTSVTCDFYTHYINGKVYRIVRKSVAMSIYERLTKNPVIYG